MSKTPVFAPVPLPSSCDLAPGISTAIGLVLDDGDRRYARVLAQRVADASSWSDGRAFRDAVERVIAQRDRAGDFAEQHRAVRDMAQRLRDALSSCSVAAFDISDAFRGDDAIPNTARSYEYSAALERVGDRVSTFRAIRHGALAVADATPSRRVPTGALKAMGDAERRAKCACDALLATFAWALGENDEAMRALVRRHLLGIDYEDGPLRDICAEGAWDDAYTTIEDWTREAADGPMRGVDDVLASLV